MDTQHSFEMARPKYLIDPGLEAVVEMALEMGLPLLVTGEPGTGKTQLAHYMAREKLDNPAGPLVFNTKTNSQAQDLFYSYDALRHFREAGHRTAEAPNLNVMNYITFNALGKAIMDKGQQRTVVLIDEIDKAPRDFSNDLLFEFEHLAFRIKEATNAQLLDWAGKHATHLQIDEQGFINHADKGQKPVLILTSNSEKNLPDAFMRRVLYYHIPFPSKQRLREIINLNIKPDIRLDDKMVSDAIEHFMDIREHKNLRKKPATAELLSWIHVLHRNQIDLEAGLKASADKQIKEHILNSYALIAKNQEDLARLRAGLGL